MKPVLAQEKNSINQNEISIQKTDNDIFEMGYIDFRIISPTALGNHFLNEGYNQDVAGFELYMNIYKVYNFRIGFGHSRFGSSLTDASLAGNFKRANYRSYYVQVSYAIYRTNLLETGLNLGYGINYFRQITRGDRRGSYNTGELRAGIYGRYQFAENFGLSFGANYLTTNKDIKSSNVGKDLFGSTHIIYPYIGLYINFE
ncbi:hypothetical protein GCM10010832_01640 [Psychroflexus planctonicus]|uniref:DUF3575 domain-containing protein n=1 Tax=Psychroflexus planctonicus TaxID=1526575 RepID=A0ABQ1SB86_9FLAO|nr:hypothetical protein GCM10010832_01640 [Psychroflexus planctonicus]